MKHLMRKFTVLFLMLAIAVSLFCVTGFAAGESKGESVKSLSLNSLIDKVKTEFSELPYVGGYCEAVFNKIAAISEYYFLIFGILALIACFYGYRLLRLALVCVGLFGGFFSGLVLYPYVLKLVSGLPAAVELIVASVCAVAGAILLHFLFRVVVFVGVGYVTYSASASYFATMQNGSLYRLLAAVGVAVLAILLLKLFVVLGSAMLGGVLASVYLSSKIAFLTKLVYQNDALFSRLEPFGIKGVSIAVLLGVVLGVLGMIFQFANTRRRRA